MSDIAIRVENLGKRYRIGHLQQRHDTLRDAIAAKIKRKRVDEGFAPSLWSPFLGHRTHLPALRSPVAGHNDFIWALKDVSFEVKRGEVVGIIGRNGAGKSTLLKVLSRITEPTEGWADIYGRVGTLLEVGTGFHPELTGRENIFLSGAILGMKRAEIERKFDEIVAFAEIEKFIDTPVKHFSSGMYVRLAFAVAAHLEPEILMVDEVLAVGDAAFQKKCLGKMGDVAKEGRTVLFVSHNMAAIRNLCERGVLLDQGRVLIDNDSALIIKEYLARDTISRGIWRRTTALPRKAGIYFEEVSITDSDDEIAGKIDSSEPFNINVSVTASRDMSNAQVAIRLVNQEGTAVFTTANTDLGKSFTPIKAGMHRYRIRIPGNFLAPGSYTLLIASMIPRIERFDAIENDVSFVIEDLSSPAAILRDGRLGVVTPVLEWGETSANGDLQSK